MHNETTGYFAKSPVNRITTIKQYALIKSTIKNGGLNMTSFVRPGKLFTANIALINKSVATLNDTAYEKAISAVIQILKNGQ